MGNCYSVLCLQHIESVRLVVYAQGPTVNTPPPPPPPFIQATFETSLSVLITGVDSFQVAILYFRSCLWPNFSGPD